MKLPNTLIRAVMGLASAFDLAPCGTRPVRRNGRPRQLPRHDNPASASRRQSCADCVRGPRLSGVCAHAHPFEVEAVKQTHVAELRYDFPLEAHVWTFAGCCLAHGMCRTPMAPS